MMWWHDGWLGWWIITPLITIAFWTTVIWTLVTMVRGLSAHPPPSRPVPRAPQEILAECYAPATSMTTSTTARTAPPWKRGATRAERA